MLKRLKFFGIATEKIARKEHLTPPFRAELLETTVGPVLEFNRILNVGSTRL